MVLWLRSAGAGGSRHLRRRLRQFEFDDRSCNGNIVDISLSWAVGNNNIVGSGARNDATTTTTRQTRMMNTHNINKNHRIVARSLSTLTENKIDSNANTQSSSLHPLPSQFLHDYDSKKFDPSTFQRNDVHFDVIDGKPPHSTTSYVKNEEIATPSEMPTDWTRTQAERWRADANDFDEYSLLDLESATGKTTPMDISKITGAQQHHATTNSIKRILWSNWTEDMIRDPKVSPILFSYADLIDGKGNDGNTNTSTDFEKRRLLQAFYQFGLVLISGTPTYTDSISEQNMSESTKEIRQRLINSSRSCNAGEDNVTSAESAILHLASIIGYHPLHTLYGEGVWSTSSYSSFYNKTDGGEDGDENCSSSAASIADSSYGSTSLPLHTDMTYISNPPGVQVFLMVQPADPAVSSISSNDDNRNAIVPKGQSVYLDGFAAARQLLHENPDAYRILASTPRRYRCIDADLGWHLEATGPVIETIPVSGLGGYSGPPVKAIRHNDLDRLPDLPPYPSTNDTTLNTTEYDAFYNSLREAHEAWDNILRRDSMRFVIDLQAGDCILVANQRCLHGRYAFETSKYPRVIMGCYVGMDELSSKWREAGLRVL
jgi:alpha-ketoglutarate-dependent taurine dioxygenase